MPRTAPRLSKKLLGSVSALALCLTLGTAGLVTFAPSLHADTPAAVTAGPGFADLVDHVKPSVVSVRVKVQSEGVSMNLGGGNNGDNPFKGTPFEKFFKNFGQPGGNDAPSDGTPGDGQGPIEGPMQQAVGSGFFVTSDGYVVTNNHVVRDAVEVEIVTDDGKTLSAKVIGTDPKTDLALIKVEGTNFPAVTLSKTKPRVGEWVLAMGNPFGLGGTVTAGIVSAEGRDIGSGPYDDYIQIDASVNKGNSGGPTFNLNGEVVGVNTAIFSPSGGSVGIAFDIPSTTVSQVVAALKANGRVDRAWLGVEIQPVTQDIADSLGMPAAKGALISRPQPGGPGEAAGLKSGDVVAAVDGNMVEDARDLAKKIGGIASGTKVKLAIIRDGKPLEMDVALGAMPEDKVKVATAGTPAPKGEKLGDLGLDLAPAASVDGAGPDGLVITKVAPNGKAATLGLQTGDILLKAGSTELKSMADLEAAMKDAKAAGKKSTLVLIQQNKQPHYIALPVS